MPLNEKSLKSEQGLKALLERAGARLGIDELRDVVRGVIAAPPPPDPDGWMSLIAVNIGDELRERLRAYRPKLSNQIRRRRRCRPRNGFKFSAMR
ncbi:MAG: hypothetical protein OEY85_06545 [Rhodospirillales bacterium]|nr:hypothetical protein [Rhodospirillales bacterium]